MKELEMLMPSVSGEESKSSRSRFESLCKWFFCVLTNWNLKMFFKFLLFLRWQVRKESTSQSKSQQKQRERSAPWQRLGSRPEETTPVPVTLERPRSPPREGARAGQEEREVVQVERALTQPPKGPGQRLWPLEGQTRGPASAWGALGWWHLQWQGHQHHAVWMLRSTGRVEVSVPVSHSHLSGAEP